MTASANLRGRMRICLVYDCLFPHTVGGAERWYRNLGERLAADGHDVTYLTLRQWERGEDPGVPGVRVIAVGPGWLCTPGGGGGSCHPWCSGSACCGTCCVGAVATTSSTPPRFPTSLCSRPVRCAARAATGWSSTGMRCGRGNTGSSTSAPGPVASARPSSSCACSSPSTPSASLVCTPSASRAPGCAERSRCSRGSTRPRSRHRPLPAPPSPSSCSPGATSRRSGRRPWSGR